MSARAKDTTNIINSTNITAGCYLPDFQWTERSHYPRKRLRERKKNRAELRLVANPPFLFTMLWSSSETSTKVSEAKCAVSYSRLSLFIREKLTEHFWKNILLIKRLLIRGNRTKLYIISNAIHTDFVSGDHLLLLGVLIWLDIHNFSCRCSGMVAIYKFCILLCVLWILNN